MINPEDILKRELISYSQVTKFNTGYVNHVYDIDGKYVLKVGGDQEYTYGMFEAQSKTLPMLESKGAKVPKILSYGIFEDKEYLLMEKMRGKNLVEQWLVLNEMQKKKIVAELADQLRLLHSISFGMASLNGNGEYADFRKAFEKCADFSLIDKNKLPDYARGCLEDLRQYQEEKIGLLSEQKDFVYVHSDLHFDNIFAAGDTLTGVIDFDFASHAPKEFELGKIVDFALNPANYVAEAFENEYRQTSVDSFLRLLSESYPELVSDKHIYDLVRIYSLENFIGPFEGYVDGRWDIRAVDVAIEKFEKLYKSEWLENTLIL